MHVSVLLPKREKKGLGSSSDFSGSFGQSGTGCGLMKEKTYVYVV